jgi:hypothetical protein
MTPKEAAEAIRPTFHLESMPAEDRHHVKFVEDVATELGVEHTAFNLHQVASALDTANLHEDSNEYPKMLYSRKHHSAEGISSSFYDKRHKYMFVLVKDEEDAAKLGSDWVDDPAKLSPLSDAPPAPPTPASPAGGSGEVSGEGEEHQPEK